MSAERPVAVLSVSELSEAIKNGHNNQRYRLKALREIASGQLNPDDCCSLMEAVEMGWRRKGPIRESRLDATKLSPPPVDSQTEVTESDSVDIHK